MRFWPDPLPIPREPDLGLEFGPASAHYRALVSHPTQYDELAAIQFAFMIKLGLREAHSLLDIGCGSLRGGRLFVPYLLPGKYCGIEPDLWPIEKGIEQELGRAVLEAKAPAFLIDDNFTCTAFGRTFDYILAHSIFSHASLDQVRRCLSEVRRCMTAESIFAASYQRGSTDNALTAWKAPGGVFYRPETMQGLAAEQDLHCVEYELHPYSQTWLVYTLPGKALKPRVLSVALDPAHESRAGTKVRVIVSVTGYVSPIESVQLCVNTFPDEGWMQGEWPLVASAAPNTMHATVCLEWDTSGLAPGRYRLGVNATAAGETEWLYERPHVTFDILP